MQIATKRMIIEATSGQLQAVRGSAETAVFWFIVNEWLGARCSCVSAGGVPDFCNIGSQLDSRLDCLKELKAIVLYMTINGTDEIITRTARDDPYH